MAPRRKVTTAAANPHTPDGDTHTTTLEPSELPLHPPSREGSSPGDMANISSLLELGGNQPEAGPSSLPRRLDKGKGRAAPSDLASTPPLATSPSSELIRELEAEEDMAPGVPPSTAAPRPISPQSSPRGSSPHRTSAQPTQDLASAPQFRRDRIPPVLGKRQRNRRDASHSPERIVLTRAELEDLLQAHTARPPTSSGSSGPASGGQATLLQLGSLAPALGTVTLPGDIPLGGRPWKRSRHFPLAEDQGLAPIDPNAIIVPRKVISALEQGMLQYIPLHILTVRACREAARTAEMDKQWKHSLQLEGGTISLKPASFDASGERKLRPLEWVDAVGRYVSLLRKHLWAGGDDAPGGQNAQILADQWESHFRLIQAQSHFEERFAVYLEYDIRIRQLWVLNPNTIRPGMWHAALYDSIVQDEIFTCIWPGNGLSHSFRKSVTATSGSNFSSGTSTATKTGDGERRPYAQTSDGERRPFARCMGGEVKAQP
ncbi:hypothetical protein M378DRAFT_174648 [Amanita muscaria Koide BX008]|uniref:Uncharacterized protein n=1 Tax=Amanita muscaria (strain Koide BX008) TaxID=946122 RepID=A0A0C2XA82_AMAMK|nr:hypothetical protein M378DRAFT_174648 [Amanita muscaria Koide BX008]